jgi:NADH:ubiquinone oxidoreductase subunit F (NADH-binding)
MPPQPNTKFAAQHVVCAFGEACAWPVQSFVGKFKDEFVVQGAAEEAKRANRDGAPPAT